MVAFEWDADKARTNLAKHGVSFDEATTVFGDSCARVITDPDHSFDKEHFVILGMSLQARELVVCHCRRGLEGAIVRIISARRATKAEVRQYWRFINA